MLLRWFKGKPVWVLGAGVAGTWMALDVVQSALAGAGDWLPLGLATAGVGWWLTRTQRSPKIAAPKSLGLERSQVEKLLTIVQQRLEVLTAESEGIEALGRWQLELNRIAADLERREVTRGRSLVLLGGRSTGKSALTQVLPTEIGGTTLEWSALPDLFGEDSEDGATDRQAEILDRAIAGDGVALVLAGDMTATELEVLRHLCQDGAVAGLQRTSCVPLVVVNKRDQWLPEEEQEVLDRIRQRLKGIIPAARVVSAAAAPRELKVRQHQPDGSVVERLEQPEPAIADVCQTLESWIQEEAGQVQWGAPMRQLQGLWGQIQGELNGVRRSRSMAAIEQSQWIAAAAAFANPVPGLDLVATAAVNGQLVMDLGKVYGLSFNLERASAIAKTFGELMVKLGLVELSSQVVAGALKTNAMTYVAGGALQAMSAAYLTRVAGLTLVELLEQQSEQMAIAGSADNQWLSPERIATVLQRTFGQVRDGFGWSDFLTQAVQRLSLTAA